MQRLVQFKYDFPPFLKEEVGVVLYYLHDHPDFPVVQIGSRVSVVNPNMIEDLGVATPEQLAYMQSSQDPNARFWQLEQELAREREKAQQLAMEQLMREQERLDQQRERERIEQEKQELERKKQGMSGFSVSTISIGFMGVESCSGTTHVALTTAFHLAKLGHKVLYIDSSPRSVLDHFSTREPMRIEHQDVMGFHWMGVDFIKQVKPEQLISFTHHPDYDFCVVDFGASLEDVALQSEWIRMNRRALTCKGAIWDLVRFSRQLFLPDQDIHVILNFGDKEAYASLKQIIQQSKWVAHANDYVPNVFEQKRKELTWLTGLIKTKKWFF